MPRLKLNVSYYASLARLPEYTERPGQLHFFVGGRDESGDVTRVGITDPRTTFYDVDVAWSGTSPDAKLHIQAFTLIKSEAGEWCLGRSGSVSVPLSQILSSNNLPYAREMRVEADDRIVKGRIQIETATSDDYDRVSALTYVPYGGVDPGGFTKAVNTYISITNRVLDKMLRPTWPALRRIRVPIYVCDNTVLPGAAFALSPRSSEPVDESYYERALEIVQERFGQRATLPQLLGGVCALYASTCTYISDKVATPRGEVPVEDFYPAETARNAGDCEDGALSALHCFLDIKETATFRNPLLREMHDLAQDYIGGIVLKGVTSPALVRAAATTGGFGNDTSGIAGAHMDSMLFPKYTFRRFLDADTAKRLGSRLDASSPGVGLPVLILEPTGLLEPSGTADTSAAVKSRIFGGSAGPRAYLRDAMSPLVRVARVMAFQPHDRASPFYRALHTFYTPEFIGSGSNIAEFIFVNRRTRTYGVSFTDAATGNSSRVSLLAMPSFGPEMLRGITSVLEQSHPVDVLHPPYTVSELANSAYESLVGAVQKYGYMLPEKQQSHSDIGSRPPFALYFSYTSVTPERVRALERFIDVAGHLLSDVEVRREDVRENLGNVVVCLYSSSLPVVGNEMADALNEEELDFITIGAYSSPSRLSRRLLALSSPQGKDV